MRTNERGAIIIHVAIALMALLCFVGIVLDQGSFYVARRQAQNAADSGALAGALTLLTDPSDHANAVIAAKALSNTNAVWGQAAGDANIDVTHPINCPDGSAGCIRVDVMRGLPNPHAGGGAHTNRFPTFMLGILGIASQGTRATAMAQVAAGNLVNKCIKPWAVADKWVDNSGTGLDTTKWDQMDFFDGGTDVYTVPGFKSTGLGNDYGLELMLKGDADWSSGWSLELELGGGNGSPPYKAEIAGCPSWVPPVGLYDSSVPCRNRSDTNEPKGCVNVNTGVRQGPTRGGVASLLGVGCRRHLEHVYQCGAGRLYGGRHMPERQPGGRGHQSSRGPDRHLQPTELSGQRLLGQRLRR